jgi:hypothetical protein
MAALLILKLALAAFLGIAIFASALIRPPRRSYPRADLRLMVASALGLYCVGLGASLSNHPAMAAAVYACGIGISALAVWLSRGTDREEPPHRDEPPEGPPPVGPDDPPEFDWDSFERELRAYIARRERERALIG